MSQDNPNFLTCSSCDKAEQCHQKNLEAIKSAMQHVGVAEGDILWGEDIYSAKLIDGELTLEHKGEVPTIEISITTIAMSSEFDSPEQNNDDDFLASVSRFFTERSKFFASTQFNGVAGIARALN